MADTFFYVNEYLCAGKSDDEAIRDCLRDARRADARTLVFENRKYCISEAILLPSDTTVILDGCTVKQKDYAFDNVFRGDNLSVDPANPFGTPLAVSALTNIRILGKNGARIEGCDINRRGYHPVLEQEQDMVGDFWGWRAFMICFSKCDTFEIANLTFTKTRSWALSFDFCINGNIHDLHLESSVKNGDGVDFRAGCSRCTVSHITGTTSDDTVACTTTVRKECSYPYKNYLYPCLPALRFEARGERDCDIHDITIRKIYTGGRMHGVICLASGGAQVYNIHISDVSEAETGARQSAVKLYTGYGEGYQSGDLHDITVENVCARISDHAVLSNAQMENVTLRAIRNETPGKETVTLEYADGVTVE